MLTPEACLHRMSDVLLAYFARVSKVSVGVFLALCCCKWMIAGHGRHDVRHESLACTHASIEV